MSWNFTGKSATRASGFSQALSRVLDRNALAGRGRATPSRCCRGPRRRRLVPDRDAEGWDAKGVDRVTIKEFPTRRPARFSATALQKADSAKTSAWVATVAFANVAAIGALGSAHNRFIRRRCKAVQTRRSILLVSFANPPKKQRDRAVSGTMGRRGARQHVARLVTQAGK